MTKIKCCSSFNGSSSKSFWDSAWTKAQKPLTQSHFKSCFSLLIMSHTVNVVSAKTLALLISAGGWLKPADKKTCPQKVCVYVLMAYKCAKWKLNYQPQLQGWYCFMLLNLSVWMCAYVSAWQLQFWLTWFSRFSYAFFVYRATVKKVSIDRQSDETEILLVILRQPEEPVAGFFSVMMAAVRKTCLGISGDGDRKQ